MFWIFLGIINHAYVIVYYVITYIHWKGTAESMAAVSEKVDGQISSKGSSSAELHVIWWFPKIGVPPKSSVLMGFSNIN